MLIEVDLLSILGTRTDYYMVKPLLKREQLTKYTWDLIKFIDTWYKLEEDFDTIKWDAFYSYITLTHPSLKEGTRDIYKNICETLLTHTVTETQDVIFRCLFERSSAYEIAGLADRIFEGDETVGMEDIQTKLVSYFDNEHVVGPESEDYTVSDDLTELFSSSIVSGGLEWRLKELRESIGPLHKGNTVLIAARPEYGKTAFLCSEMSFMATQLGPDEKVLWICNEEPGIDVKRRIISSTIGKDLIWIMGNATKAMDAYNKEMGSANKIIMWDQPRITMDEIRVLCKRFQPKLIICDQLRNVQGFERGTATEVERLKKLYQEWRSLAKEYGPAVTVHQSRGDAHGVLYPEGNQLEGCQTEVQGALDVQIMMGRDYSELPDLRGLHIVKNKTVGGPSTDPTKKHGKYVVKIVENLSRLESYGL